MDKSEAEKDWPDLAGRLAEGEHCLPIRVYFEDTDFTGLVYHANFLKFCERGRSDFVRKLGVSHTKLERGDQENGPSVFVVRGMEIDFFAPAHIDDVLLVKTRIGEVGAATLVLNQSVLRHEKLLMTAKVRIVLISKRGKPLRIGQRLRETLTKFSEG